MLSIETVTDSAIGIPKNFTDVLNHLHKKIINGWEIFFSYQIVQDRDVERKIYILSAMLYPNGRGSKVADWHFIGWVTGYFERKIGTHVHILTPLETTDPNGVFKWVWISPDKNTDNMFC